MLKFLYSTSPWPLFSLQSSVYLVRLIDTNSANDWIQIAYLLCWNQPLYKLRHNCCLLPQKIFFLKALPSIFTLSL